MSKTTHRILVTVLTAILTAGFFQLSLGAMAPQTSTPGQVAAGEPTIFQWALCGAVFAGFGCMQWPGLKANWKHYQNSRFIRAAHVGDTHAVSSYLKSGFSPVVLGQRNWQYIDFNRRFESNNPWSMDLLYEHPGITMKRINSGQGAGQLMPFVEAASQGHDAIVSLMFQADVKQQISQKDKDAALYMAARNRHVPVVKTLLQNKANAQVRSYQGGVETLLNASNALILSFEQNDLEIFTLFMNSIDKYEAFEVSKADRAKVTRTCYCKGIRKTDLGLLSSFDSLFLRAMRDEKIEFLKVMLQKQDAISILTLCGGLFLACELNQKKVIRMILDYKMNSLVYRFGEPFGDGLIDHLKEYRERYPFTFEQVYDEYKKVNTAPLVQPVLQNPEVGQADGGGNITEIINGYV